MHVAMFNSDAKTSAPKRIKPFWKRRWGREQNAWKRRIGGNCIDWMGRREILNPVFFFECTIWKALYWVFLCWCWCEVWRSFSARKADDETGMAVLKETADAISAYYEKHAQTAEDSPLAQTAQMLDVSFCGCPTEILELWFGIAPNEYQE